MKNIRNSLALLIATAMLLTLIACSAGQSEEPVYAPLSVTEPQVMTIAYAAAPDFTDVPAGADYAEAVAWCQEQGLMVGTSATEFSPDATLTRAMVVTVLYRAAGEPAVSGAPGFSDTQAGVWYSNAVTWASGQGIIAGYGNGLFGTNDPVTKEQLDVMIHRYNGETPNFTGNPALTVPATRAEAAVAFYAGLRSGAVQSNAITTNGGNTVVLSKLEHYDVNAGSTVYYTSEITPEALMSIYEALNWTPTGKVAVKLSTGEPPASNYLDPALIKDVVQTVDGTIVECNTAYGGSRASAAMHLQVAKDHGFTDIAEVDIMDADGSMTLPVTGGDNLTENYVGTHFSNYDSFLVLSHFKGHSMAGFGGAIKNISIGIASAQGKGHIHSGGSGGSMWGGSQDAFLESMAEAGKSVVEALDGQIVYINVMNRLSVDCDCNGNPAQPDMHDIGILASTDPVALDQACVDLVYTSEDGSSLIRRMESRNGIHTLEQAEKIGLGSRSYKLTDIDSSNTVPGSEGENNQMDENSFYVKANGTTFTAAFADNSSAEALKELLKTGDVSIAAHDYSDFEKVGDLGSSLPRNDTQLTSSPGDIFLYQGNRVTIFYGSNSWSYTRLGKIEGASRENLLTAFGNGDVTITLSLNK